MARGKRWTEAENTLLEEMSKQGMNAKEIYESGRLPDRTQDGIREQLKRLKIVQTKNFFVQTIEKAEILGFEEFVGRYVDAFVKLCETQALTRDELERFRLIFMAAWKYRELFREYEEIEGVKRDVQRLKGLVAQLLAEKKKET